MPIENFAPALAILSPRAFAGASGQNSSAVKRLEGREDVGDLDREPGRPRGCSSAHARNASA